MAWTVSPSAASVLIFAMPSMMPARDNGLVDLMPFRALAARDAPPLDELALALAAEFRDVDAPAALARLDELGEEVRSAGGNPLDAVVDVLARRHGFAGAGEQYDDPANSMLDVVVERRAGLPILLSIVYVEVARRAGLALAGVGLPGHYVVGRFAPPAPVVVLDAFAGGVPLDAMPGTELVRPWGAHETALRMLNNLVGSYTRRNDLERAIRAAEMRLELPLSRQPAEALGAELRSLRARLN
jgi:regulator of sirC expression with transglutaminase-like and TPR domain